MGYWDDRFIQLQKAKDSYGEEIYREIEESLNKAQAKIQKEIESWYTRFAVNNNVDMSVAKQLLDSESLKELKWDVKEYIEYGRKNAITGEWAKQLENASAKVHIRKLEAIQIRIQAAIENAYNDQSQIINNAMKSTFEDSYYRTIYEIQSSMGIGFDVSKLDANKINMFMIKPWANDGNNFSKRIWNNKRKLLKELHKGLLQNVVLGETPKRLINHITKTMQTTKKNARRLVMTEISYFHNTAQINAFKEMEVEEYEILAVLDLKTSSICQDFDGMHFPMSQYRAGDTAPPFHCNCRSIITPYSQFSGLKKRLARGLDGKTYEIPKTMKYHEWKERYIDNVPTQNINKSKKGKSKNNKDDNSWVGLNYENKYNKASAIKRLKDGYSIEFVDSEQFPVDDNILSDCVSWLDSFNRQYPMFMRNNNFRLPKIEMRSNLGSTIGVFEQKKYSDMCLNIQLNDMVHFNKHLMSKLVDGMKEKKWWVENAIERSTFVHEFGHYISNIIRVMKNDSNWEKKFIKSCKTKFAKTQPNYDPEAFKTYVSEYGTNSDSELFAEAFAEYFGGKNPREFATIFGKKLERLLREVK